MEDYYSLKAVEENTICFNSVSAGSHMVQFYRNLGDLF